MWKGSRMGARVRARIKYSPKKESTGEVFEWLFLLKKIQLPIFAYKNLISAKNAKEALERNKKKNLSFHYEVWEVQGQKSYKEFCLAYMPELENGNYYPIGSSFPSDTIFLRTCIPISKIK